jgi:hypothetical protein
LFTHVLKSYDRRVRKPHNLGDICVMLTAACEGLVLRQRFQPDRLQTADGNLIGVMARQVVHTFTEPVERVPNG